MSKHLLRDLAERVVWTFVEAFAGVFGAVLIATDLSTLAVAAASGLGAGIAAAAAAIKTFAATQVGDPDTAALFPSDLASDRRGQSDIVVILVVVVIVVVLLLVLVPGRL